MNREGAGRLVLAALAERSLGKVAAALREIGAPVAPVKGVVLSRWIYDDVRERPYADVDLLMPRAAFARAEALVARRGWPVAYCSRELGELCFTLDHVMIELHAEIGRPDLSRLTVEEVLGRAAPDRATFPFEILRIDEIDHFLLLVANVVKDGFTYANAHQPGDLERMLGRLEPRLPLVLERARAAALSTALANLTAWMIEEHGSRAFLALPPRLAPAERRGFRAAVRLQRALERRRGVRLGSLGGLVGLALATLTPDDRALRRRGLARVVRRGLQRSLGRDPG